MVGFSPGALINGLQFAPGKVGQAFTYNTTNVGVRIGPTPALDLGIQNGFTIECWVKPNDTNAICPIIVWAQELAFANGTMLMLSVPESSGGKGAGSVWFSVGNGGAANLSSAAGVVQIGAWQHLAATYDKVTGDAAIYLNGELVGQTNVGVLMPAMALRDCWLGYDPHADFWDELGTAHVNSFKGQIDEVALYRRVLSPSEIRGVFNADTFGKCQVPPTQIIIQPPNRRIGPGKTVTFSALANGSSPVTYQWQFNGTNLPSATNGMLLLTNIVSAQGGNYTVQACNSAGCFSNTAVLTVLPPFGLSWTATRATNTVWDSIYSSADARLLVAASYYGTIFMSTNFGDTWIQGPAIGGGNGNHFLAGSADGAVLYATAGQLVLKSTNSGVTWAVVSSLAGGPTAITCSANGAKVAVATTSDILASTNGGGVWISSGMFPYATTYNGISSSADGSILVALQVGLGPHYSTNFGRSWTRASGVPNNNWWCCAVSADGRNAAAGSFFNTIMWCSTNIPSSWTAAGAPQFQWAGMTWTAGGSKLMAAAYNSGIYSSLDYGQSWTQEDSPANPFSIACSADGARMFAAMRNGGIYRWQVPSLEISLAGGTAILSWTTNAHDFEVQAYAGNSWVSLTNAPQINPQTGKNEVAVPAAAGNFFRLKSP